MLSFTTAAALAATLSFVPHASAHGHLSRIMIGDQSFAGTNPDWAFKPTKPNTPGWYANNKDNGFVEPAGYASTDIVCHKGATPGLSSIPVDAGASVDLQWDTWPESHHGPVMTYMAEVTGEFTDASPADLDWFKVAQGGLERETGFEGPGYWASDSMIANNYTATFTVPASLKPGNYVVRHEIIALHQAYEDNGAQNYPQCINMVVAGTGTARPCADGAACAVGTALYKSTDPGVLISIYQSLSEYIIPGPAVWNNARVVKRAAKAFKA